jgi:hypothetical protein
VGERQQQWGQLPAMGSHYRGWGTTDEDRALLMRTGLGPLGRTGNHKPGQGTTDEDLKDGTMDEDQAP